MKDFTKEELRASKEDLLLLWMQMKKTVETVANEAAYKGREWSVRVKWGDKTAGPDVEVWIESSSIDINAPRFFNPAREQAPEPEPEKEIEVP